MHKKTLDKLKSLDERETGGFAECIDIAVNGRVMLRLNDKRVQGLVNGARSTVTNVIKDRTGKFVSQILVKFDEIDAIQCIERKQTGPHYLMAGPGGTQAGRGLMDHSN